MFKKGARCLLTLRKNQWHHPGTLLHLSFYFHQEKSCGERKTRGADAVRQMGVSTSPRAAAAVVDSLVCNFLIKRSRAASTRIATLEWASLSLSLSRLFTLQRLDAERLRYCPSVAPAATFGTHFNSENNFKTMQEKMLWDDKTKKMTKKNGGLIRVRRLYCVAWWKWRRSTVNFLIDSFLSSRHF